MSQPDTTSTALVLSQVILTTVWPMILKGGHVKIAAVPCQKQCIFRYCSSFSILWIMLIYLFTDKQIEEYQSIFTNFSQFLLCASSFRCYLAGLLEMQGIWAVDIHSFSVIQKSHILKANLSQESDFIPPTLLMRLLDIMLSHVTPICE